MGEYVFCALCKRNVDDGKRHPFTKTHQERVKEVLRNQSEQYAKYKHFLLDVATISSRTKQPDFYCTFCKVKVRPTAKEVMEHVRTFACLHIFEHMATAAHHERVDAWFKTNHGDFKLKKSHVISEKSIGKYRERIRKKTEELDQAEQAKAEWKRRERAEEKDKETRGAQVEIRVEVNGGTYVLLWVSDDW
ncbi:hypothetical protein BC938DRAFT_471689 [Jimgerdemannia flammicorona]|uniref:Uncharacterized protein n=1 Tax=Jimgerdemannia flammicorona TaxID=994334 RepID=A0A433Q7I1_9FUNG|nr:hypothetical protein BC938DRAFT_471689 [Jimgerdemannia flammicorona]